tara:strand:- start:45 stop:464 length:420 start_codon:yes stop_codon:yes gene_type:complete
MPDKQYSTSWQSAKQKAKDRTRQRNPSQIGYNIVSDMKRLSIKGANEITPQETTNLNMKAIKGMPMFSPVRGNTFTKVMADTGGDYEKTKEILANDVATMKVQYGTGSPTTLKIDKIEYEGGSTSADKKPRRSVNRQIK